MQGTPQPTPPGAVPALPPMPAAAPTPAAAPPPATAPPAEPAPPEPAAAPVFELGPDELAAGVTLGDQQVIVPLAAYRPLIDAAIARGRQEFESSIAPRLAALEISTLDDLLQAIEEAAKNPTPQPETTMPDPVPPTAAGAPVGAPPAAPIATPPVPAAPLGAAPPLPPAVPQPPGIPPADPTDRYLTDAARKRVAAIRGELTARATAAEQAKTLAEQQAAAHQATIDRMRGEETLKLGLASSGITEFEFAWHQLQQHIAELSQDKTPDGLAKFQAFSKDPKAAVKAWADEQRKTRPYLFGVQAVPANTSAPAGTQPPPTPQDPAAVTAAATGAGSFDARKASPQEFRQRMNQLGVKA